jgi:hypothetical protein
MHATRYWAPRQLQQAGQASGRYSAASEHKVAGLSSMAPTTSNTCQLTLCMASRPAFTPSTPQWWVTLVFHPCSLKKHQHCM